MVHFSTRECSLSPHSDRPSRVEPHSRRVSVSPSNLLVSTQTSRMVRRRSGLSNGRRAGGGNFSGRHLQRVLSTEPWHWRPGLFTIG